MAALKNYQLGLDITDEGFMDDNNARISGKALRLRLGDTVRFTLELNEKDHGADTYSAYVIPDGTTLKAGIKERWQQGNSVPFLALVETWTITDASAGQAYFELDLATSNLTTFLTGYEYREAWLEIELTASTGEVLTSMAESIDVRFASIGDSPTSPTTAPGYYTKTEADARYAASTSLASNANGAGASLIGIEDAGGLITATTVEGALAELAAGVGGGGLAKNGTITSDADAGEGLYVLDASGAAFDFTLPAATGSQKRYFLLAGDVQTNAATIKVQTGEKLNGVTNGDRVLDRDERVVLAVDVGSGEWTAQDLTESGLDTIGFNIDGGGSVITANSKGFTRAPFDCELIGWYMTSTYDETGDAVLDVWAHASQHPTNTDSITNGNEPSISTAKSSNSLDLSGWINTRRKRGDFLAVHVDSVATFTGAELRLICLLG